MNIGMHDGRNLVQTNFQPLSDSKIKTPTKSVSYNGNKLLLSNNYVSESTSKYNDE